MYIGANNTYQLRFQTSGHIVMDNGGYLQSNASLRAPIFYDSNDTTYYVNPNSTGTSIRAAGTVHASLSNMSAYQLNGTYVMDSSRNLVNIVNITSSGTGAFSGTVNFTGDMTAKNTKFLGGTSYNENIRMHANSSNDYSSLVLGAVSGDSGTGTGQWTLVRYPSTTHSNKFTIRHNSTDHVTITTSGNLTNHVDTRSPIFYDSNDTAKYLDPNSTSILNTVKFSGSTNNGRFFGDSWGLKLQTDSGYIHFGPANSSLSLIHI